MLPSHPHICLYQPEIPQNTGNIGRLAAAMQCRLHLVRPFGFTTSDKNLRRAGLDYWPFLDLEIHENFDQVARLFPGRIAFLSKKSTRPYTEMPVSTELLVFGQETKGLPDFLWQEYPEMFYHVPMFHPGVRSLNLANAVSIVLFHQLHKRGCFGASES